MTGPEASADGAKKVPDQKDVLIAVMGLTGSGKSTFINLITQSENELAVGHSITSQTQSVDHAEPFELDGRRVILFDTPGSDDTNKDESEVLRIIAFELEKQYKQGTQLHGVIYVHRISDIRVGGLAKNNFRTFRKLCGDDSLHNVVIVTNMWSKVTEEEGLERVKQLTSLDDFFAPALAKKARMVHNVQNTVESAREIISMIIKNNPVPLIIQEELVKDGKDITQTSAGKEVDKRLAELAAQYEVKLQDNIKAIQDAQKERDEETAREMKEEKETVQKKLDKLNLDRENQNKEYQRLQSQFQQAEQDRQREAKLAQDRLDAAEAQRRRDAIDAQNKINEAVAAIRQPPPTAPRPTPGPATRSPATLETIESGKRHTIRNVKNGRYVTLAANEKDIIGASERRNSTQQWIFTKTGGNWTIKSGRRTDLYLSTTSGGTVRARTTAEKWNIRGIVDEYGQFRLYNTEWSDKMVLLLDDTSSGAPIELEERKGRSYEKWEVVGYF